MDIFLEYIIKHKKTAIDYLVSAAGFLGAAILTVLFSLINRYLLGFGFFLTVASWFGAYMLMKYRYVEYEYILTNNELDVDKIYAKTRRKRIITVDFKNIEICAAVGDSTYQSNYNNAPQVVYDFTGISDYDKYFVDLYYHDKRVRVLFQPTDKMKENIKLLNPGRVHLL